MIGKLTRGFGAMLLYACVATIIAQALLAAYLVGTWDLNRQKMVQMLAIAYGIDLFAIRDQLEDDLEQDVPEQVSYEQVLETRAVKIRHLELREQSLRDGLDLLRVQRQEVAEAKKRYEQLKAAFDAQLAALGDEARGTGLDDNRAKLEALRPNQAKELLVDMIRKDEMGDVVALLREMPANRAARIIAEFKTPEELEHIGEVLRRIREGDPTAGLAASTRERLGLPETERP